MLQVIKTTFNEWDTHRRRQTVNAAAVSSLSHNSLSAQSEIQYGASLEKNRPQGTDRLFSEPPRPLRLHRLNATTRVILPTYPAFNFYALRNPTDQKFSNLTGVNKMDTTSRFTL